MANNNNVVNPYTTNIPGGTLSRFELVNPKNVAIQWPSISGNTVPKNGTVNNGFLRGLFQ